ncbi:MAG: bifunctional adenosylcobinamide kinase/adenosylcobinamide-phosphate guanylyltransferase [Peptoniphilus sp.]|nr:bifunctional adenosylcobinamide kinase/adenosylcobinamide-phosphate guanylyltransferase [Peptoniphilus sp.]MDD7363726.1 bifunctional adenosylcobinamide kinase/adenosylcobinamide-phosphate guanylyltransferase [Bacillota bacterium]MDY6044111.1 bifunctional adenosylcobinamide kinase/adenosylcobinamide-phosphate guanylyltransferase [Peptoniphilus sp.]
MILITGGARSGKSAYAEDRCSGYDRVTYIATARASSDPEMKERIERHRARRPSSWKTVERDRDLAHFAKDTEAILLDCVTVLIGNYLLDAGKDAPDAEEMSCIEEDVIRELERLIEASEAEGTEIYIVTNEVGSGIVPMNALSRAFRDIQGRVNQHLASRAREVYVCVSGIPVKIK